MIRDFTYLLKESPGPLALLALLTLVSGLHADNLTLLDEARLSGTVRSVRENGVVEIASVLSPALLQLEPGAVTKIEFSDPGAPLAQPETMIELTNGDLLPVSIESFVGDKLNVISPAIGPLCISRTLIKSVELSPHPHRQIYVGPRNLEEWQSSGDSSKSWRFTNESLITNGPAVASKPFKLPLSFTFKFTLKWQGMPNYRIYFADPLISDEVPVDRYCIYFDGETVGIQREANNSVKTVIFLNRTPESISPNDVKVEIRVDRKNSRLSLYLDGEPEGVGIDPVSPPPRGNGIRLVSHSSAGTAVEICKIEMTEFDNTGLPRSENRGDLTVDSLISRDADRWSGRLTGIRKSPEGNVFLFKSDFQPEPLELLECDLTTLFFAQSESPSPPLDSPLFTLQLRGQGHLSVASCIFSEAGISATHPLLGSLKISRGTVSTMERVSPHPQAEDQE
jgi:hypothetical protein